MGVTTQQMLRAAWRRAIGRAASFAESPTLAKARRLKGDLSLIFTLDKKLKQESKDGWNVDSESAEPIDPDPDSPFTHYPRGRPFARA